MGCLYCGKDIGAFRLLRDSEFCGVAHRKKYGERLGKALHEIAAPEQAPARMAGFRDQMPLQRGSVTLSLQGFQTVPGKEIQIRKEWPLAVDESDPGNSGAALRFDGEGAMPAVEFAAPAVEEKAASAVAIARQNAGREPLPPIAGFLQALAAEPVAAFLAYANAAHAIFAAPAALAAGLRPALAAAAVRPALHSAGMKAPDAEPVTSFVHLSAHPVPLPAVASALKTSALKKGVALTPVVAAPAHAPALVRTWAATAAAEPVTALVHMSAATEPAHIVHINKYATTEVRQPLADARGSDRSRDREGAVESKHAVVLAKRCTNLPAFTTALEPSPLFDRDHAIPAACAVFAPPASAEPVTAFVHMSAATEPAHNVHIAQLPAFTTALEPSPLFDRDHAIPAACATFAPPASAEPVTAFVQASASLAISQFALRLPALPAAMIHALPQSEAPKTVAGEPAAGAVQTVAGFTPVFSLGTPRTSALVPASLAGAVPVAAVNLAPGGLRYRESERTSAAHGKSSCHWISAPIQPAMPAPQFTADLEPLPALDEISEPPVMCQTFLAGAAADPVASYLQASLAPALEIAVPVMLPGVLASLAAIHIPRIRQSQAAPFAEAVMALVRPVAATAPMIRLAPPAITLPTLPEHAAAERFESPAAATLGAPAEAVETMVAAGDSAIPISIHRAPRASVVLEPQPEWFAPAPAVGNFLPGLEPAPLESFLVTSLASALPMGEMVRLLPLAMAASQERIIPSFHAQQMAPAIAQPAPAQPRREDPHHLATVLVLQPEGARAHLDRSLPRHGLHSLEFHPARLRSDAAGRPEWIASRIPLMPPRFSVTAALDKLEDPALAPKTPRKEPQILNMPAKRQPSVFMVFGRVAATFLLASSLWYGVTNFRSDRHLPSEDLSSSGPAIVAGTLARPAAGTAATASAPPPAAATGPLGWVRQAITERASLKVAENFRSTESWESADKSRPAGWNRHPDGYMNTGGLALFSPTLKFKDYRMEFFGQIENRSIGWTVRSADARNYHAMKLTVVEAGTRPFVALVQYNVVDGKAGRKTQTPLNLMVHNNKPMQFAVDVKGNRFVTTIDGEEVDAYTDNTLVAGGVGFFSEAGERARLYWLRVARNDDWLGHVCAMLADTVSTAELRIPARPGTPFRGLPAGDDGLMLGAVWFGLPYLRASRKKANRQDAHGGDAAGSGATGSGAAGSDAARSSAAFNAARRGTRDWNPRLFKTWSETWNS